ARCPAVAMELEERVEAEVVGPRDVERHLLRRVDAALGDPKQLDQLVFARQAQLESRRGHADVPERLDVHEPRRSGWPSEPSSAMSRRKKSDVVQSVTTRSFCVTSGSW